jgi:hypothetical protein
MAIFLLGRTLSREYSYWKPESTHQGGPSFAPLRVRCTSWLPSKLDENMIRDTNAKIAHNADAAQTDLKIII